MSVKIETEKKVNGNGDKGRKIISVSALKESDLPEAYLSGKGPVMYMTSTKRLNTPGGRQNKDDVYSDLTPGNFYPEDEFQPKLKYIRAAGDRLHRINTKLKDLRENWHGQETFVI